MRLLRDTHALIWWVTADRRLQAKERAAIADPESIVHVSAATLWEIAIKQSLGRIKIAADLAKEMEENAFLELRWCSEPLSASPSASSSTPTSSASRAGSDSRRERIRSRWSRSSMKLVPREDWIDLAHIVIHHERRVCAARDPDCESCVVAPLCPKIGGVSSS